MKKSILSFVLAGSMLLISLFLASCGGGDEVNNQQKQVKEHVHQEGEEHDMELNHKETDTETSTEHTYSCTMHPEVKGVKGDQCSKCGMDLHMEEHEH